MTEEITQQPLARAVLAALARSRGQDDPLGSLARTALSGQAALRDVAAHSWHGRALNDAFVESLEAQRRLPADVRADIDRQARQLRDAGEAALQEPDGAGPDEEGSSAQEGGDR